MKAWLLLGGLLLLLSISANVRFIVGSRATLRQGSGVAGLSQENSYLFVSPLKARADGKDRIRLSVIVLDAQGKGVSNQDVMVTTKPSIPYEGIQIKTDLYGRAVYDLYTTSVGSYEITANVAGNRIGEPVTVQFE
ncbi:hypothetical protein COU89_02710 [Candidatus Roizmanbacteria bacterium CG10_big_fil_rev_8_21_14_0_10_45_7]|uniref:Big-1 domain-containing protein n=1 Tax=Candidatus Roizmanbacteria bacterium CG10_big_fil_rev_8_21_14_0_10_45_7 TaxID=1974854 RepID=A0A2M8KUE9_9BACT|nr:MAG: hypothetical protein COU89_02710 [Candidatus Roizmanbacteria bacterium CG10_big_fil_rev_8_21_14_0_10_45_7]